MGDARSSAVLHARLAVLDQRYGEVETEVYGVDGTGVSYGQFENWEKCQQLLPHVESLYGGEPASESVKEWAQVLTNSAEYMWMKGSCNTAQDVAAKAVAAGERTLGQDDQLTLKSIKTLALVLQYQGKYDKAEKMNWRALVGREKQLGAQHPYTLASVMNLAFALHCRGKDDEAEKINRRALEGCEKELGTQHPSMLTSMSNLAVVLQF